MFEDGYSFGFSAFFGFLTAAFILLIFIFISYVIIEGLSLIFDILKAICYEICDYITSLRVKRFFAKNPNEINKVLTAKDEYEAASGRKILLFIGGTPAFKNIAKKTGYPANWIRIILQNNAREQRKKEKEQVNK
jgi:hypothetical protein